MFVQFGKAGLDNHAGTRARPEDSSSEQIRKKCPLVLKPAQCQGNGSDRWKTQHFRSCLLSHPAYMAAVTDWMPSDWFSRIRLGGGTSHVLAHLCPFVSWEVPSLYILKLRFRETMYLVRITQLARAGARMGILIYVTSTGHGIMVLTTTGHCSNTLLLLNSVFPWKHSDKFVSMQRYCIFWSTEEQIWSL